MANPLLAPELREILAQKDAKALATFFRETTPTLSAELLSALEPAEIREALAHAEPRMRAEIFDELDDDVRLELAEMLTRGEFAQLLTNMSADERVDLVKKLPEERLEALMPGLAQAEREDIRRLAAYSEGTAGSVMTSDYATLSPDLTVGEALSKLRREAPDKETIYYCYVVDALRKLVGFVTLKDLILASPSARLIDMMHRDVISVSVDDDQEDAARDIAKYNLIALPVVDPAGAIVGIITHDDAIDILNQENVEDIEKLMAIAGSHEPDQYIKTSFLGHFRNRVGWVIALAVLGLVSGAIIQGFEDVLLQFAILATFIPMIADTGGNTGSQSATLVVRSLAMGEITTKDAGRVLAKEFGVAMLLAVVLATVSFGRVFIFHGSAPETYPLMWIGLAVAVALGLQVLTSTLVGALLPLGAAKLKLDPAVVASPALTTVVDITGLLIFFSTAKVILGV